MIDAQKPRWNRREMQSVIGFIFSFCIHVTLCIALAFVVFGAPGVGGNQFSFTVGDPGTVDNPDLTEFEISGGAIADDQPSDVDPSQMIGSLTGSGTSDPNLSAGIGANAPATGGGSGISSMVAGLNLGKEGSGSKSGNSASFFGTSAHGDRFVFVIDSSGSMRGPRWQALCKELLRAIQTLSPEQEFFIISFDSDAHPMFGKVPPKGTFLKPTRENVVRVRNWINSIELGRQTFPATSVYMALRMKPDAIFLLSDGEINDSTILDLRQWNRSFDDKGYEMATIPIHTFLLHSQVGYFALETIANENDGVFTPIPEPQGFW